MASAVVEAMVWLWINHHRRRNRSFVPGFAKISRTTVDGERDRWARLSRYTGWMSSARWEWTARLSSHQERMCSGVRSTRNHSAFGKFLGQAVFVSAVGRPSQDSVIRVVKTESSFKLTVNDVATETGTPEEVVFARK